MTNFMSLASLLREQMQSTLSRSDILKPFAWLIAIIAGTISLAFFSKPSEWVLVALVVCLVGAMLLYGFAAIYCLFRDRDALRSERYSLQKFALEHKLLGDSNSGLFDAEEVVPGKIADQAANKQIEY